MSLPQRGEPEFWVSFLGAELPPLRFLSHFSFLEGEMKRTGGRRCLRRLPTFLLQATTPRSSGLCGSTQAGKVGPAATAAAGALTRASRSSARLRASSASPMPSWRVRCTDCTKRVRPGLGGDPRDWGLSLTIGFQEGPLLFLLPASSPQERAAPTPRYLA